MDHQRFEKFQALRTALKKELRWGNTGTIRDATALAALDLEGTPSDIARSLAAPAAVLKENHARLALLRNAVRYAIAATLLRRGLDARQFTMDIAQTRESWKAAGLRRGAPYEGASIFILHLSGKGAADLPSLTLLKQAFDDLNQRRYWHVGTRTMPPLALALQYRTDAPAAADAIFGALKEEKRIGDRRTMEAALIASLADMPPADAARRINDMRQALLDARLHHAARNIGGLALALLADPAPEKMAAEIEEVRQALKKGAHRSSNAASLALDYWTHERLAGSHAPQAALAPLMIAIQAYLAMMQQQAAMTAAIAGGVTASAGAS